MLPAAQSTLADDHAVAVLGAESAKHLQVSQLHTTRTEESLHVRARIEEVRIDQHQVSVKIVPATPTAALLNLTEKDSPSSKVSADA